MHHGKISAVNKQKMAALPPKKKRQLSVLQLSVLRRHRLNEADVRRVLSHLKVNDTITANDVLSRPRLKKKKGAPPEEPIPWAQGAELAGSWQRKDLKAGPKNKSVLYAKENDVWKLVVPHEQIETFLRHAILDPESTMPLARDSAYHHVQKGVVGISRRALYAFLEKQGVLQLSKNIPNERVKGGIILHERGYCEMDLIEGRGRDLPGARGNWFWLSLVDVFTGYGLVQMIREKATKVVAPALRELLDQLEHDMQAKVTTIAADHGREFYKDVKTLLKRRRITLKQVSRGSRVEKFNQDYQRNFYRLMNLRRGTFASVEDQALKLTNNTRNKHTKKTPKEALGTPDAELALGYNKPGARESSKPYKAKVPKVGDKCRYLIKLRKNIRPILKIGDQARLYKSYHGRHFTKQVHKIKIITPDPKKVKDPPDPKAKPPRYYVNGEWRDRDMLLLVSGVDAETDRQVAARSRAADR
jgi:hypothetical protein